MARCPGASSRGYSSRDRNSDRSDGGSHRSSRNHSHSISDSFGESLERAGYERVSGGGGWREHDSSDHYRSMSDRMNKHLDRYGFDYGYAHFKHATTNRFVIAKIPQFQTVNSILNHCNGSRVFKFRKPFDKSSRFIDSVQLSEVNH